MTEFEAKRECRLCTKIETKSRRRSLELERLDRWTREGSALVATISRSQMLVLQLEKEIRQLQVERDERRKALSTGNILNSTTVGTAPGSSTGIETKNTSRPKPTQETTLENAPLSDIQQALQRDESSGVQENELPNTHTYTNATKPCSDSGYASAINPSDAKYGADSAQDDNKTEYSEASTNAISNSKSFVSELADDLFKKVTSLLPDGLMVARIPDILPEILKAFALRIGHNAPTQMYRDIMFFVHKHR